MACSELRLENSRQIYISYSAEKEVSTGSAPSYFLSPGPLRAQGGKMKTCGSIDSLQFPISLLR
jgi:hypothetical protein